MDFLYDDEDVFLRKEEEEEEEEEWEDDDEEEEEDDVDDEDEEEEEEEKEKKPADEAGKKAGASDGKDAKKDAKKEEKKEEEKKKKKPAAPPKEKKPKTPEEKLHIGKIVFLVGLGIFFLSTCAERSHIHKMLSAKYQVAAYSHKYDKPVEPMPEYIRESTKLKAEDRAEENKEIRKKRGEAAEKFVESAEMQDYLVAMEDWNEEKYEDTIALKEAQQNLQEAEDGIGAWAMTRFYFGQLGLLLMIVGLGFILVLGTPWEKGAALLVIWLGLVEVMTQGTLLEGMIRSFMR